MTCVFCKGDVNFRTASFTSDGHDRYIIVKDAPAFVCSQCGAISYSHDVTDRLEKICCALYDTGIELAVVRYSDT